MRKQLGQLELQHVAAERNVRLILFHLKRIKATVFQEPHVNSVSDL